MADVELVIKIPEEDYKRGAVMASAIRNGTLLPKGHGKLIDVKDLLKLLCLEDTEQNRKLNMGEHITLEDIDCIEPIIEADKSEGGER
jgi:hypothetical protein